MRPSFWHLLRPIALVHLTSGLLSTSSAQGPSISVSSLLVENKLTPIGIDVNPRFSWITTSSARAVSQLGYQLKVSAAEAGDSDVWDSGEVTSALPYLAEYAGPPLHSDTQYFWSVTVLTNVGSSSASSTFTTGILKQEDWSPSVWIGKNDSATSPSSFPPIPSITSSQWIWAAEPDLSQVPAGDVAFRRAFAVPEGKTALSATIVITVDDLYSIFVNGVPIGNAPEEPDAWKMATVYRVMLNSTMNLFAIRATNVGPAANAAGVLVAISILYSDGSTDSLLSDTTWKADKTVPAGFELPSTDDSQWAIAVSLGTYGVAPWNTQLLGFSDPLGEHPAPLLRKSFTIAQEVVYARLYYSVGGFASISLNGAPASDYLLSPGFTKYNSQVQYVGLDVSALLKQGENVLAVELGRSYYGISQEAISWWDWTQSPWHGEPALRSILSIGFADGTKSRIVSDSSWKFAEGPTRLDDIYGGENYDASYIIPGYDKPGFDDASWHAVQVSRGPTGVLVNARQPPTRLTASLRPVSITEPVPGIFVAAFERVVAGWAKITATGPAKTLLTINFGEKLNPDGTVIYLDVAHNFVNNWQTDRFWLAGTGVPETFEPKYSYKGFQYIQIQGWPGSLPPTEDDIICQVVHDDFAPYGGFESSSELLNKLHQAVLYTLLNNVHSFPTDCPTFEKKGWSGDAMLGAEMYLANFDSSELLAKYVRDLDETRINGTGQPDVIAPDDARGSSQSPCLGCPNQPAPTWHSALILIPAWLYSYRGDKRVLSDHYASMKDYIEFELRRSPGGIASSWLGDWVTPETSPQGGNPPEDSRVPATAFLYRMLDTMHDIANVLGNSADAELFAAQAATVKTAFNDAFFNQAAGHYIGSGDSGYRQGHNLLALAFNLTPNNATAIGVADSVASDVLSRGTHLNTGALSTKHLLPLLTSYGHVDTAFALAEQTTFPSWGFWIQNGATTTWEHWSAEARSHDHYFLGTYDDWLFQYVLGIQSTATAFQSVTIAPAFTGHLTSASGWRLTPFGNLTVSWKNADGSISLDLRIPVGVTATVSFTTGAVSRVFESGEELKGTSRGMTVLDSRPGEPLRLSVRSGKYSFIGK
ncbi:bacterial alpha-L-rhamnosidase-domain-containing protein [Mycena rebaudengoi]|nr:bacterial alpha-L-rhamnosidase-domain-containing protein [Mycena rebaudengoi]